jgi:riboflavin kinase/FMN adenylyltransferase
MLVFHDFTKFPNHLRQGVVAIGNFDGLHLGHQYLLKQARDIADSNLAPFLMLTFEPHPRKFFVPDLPPFRLTPFRSKMEKLAALRLDAAVVMHFDKNLAGLTADEFVEKILIQGLGAKHIVVGSDFQFGKGRAGSAETLRGYEAQGKFAVTGLYLKPDGAGEVISSSRIREFLKDGNPVDAAQLLGRPWLIEGHVFKGDQRGRQIGYPTANIRLQDYQPPKFGVYAVDVNIEGEEKWRSAIVNIGVRPTFGDGLPVCEVHIPNFSGDLYGKLLRVRLLKFIRPEQKFSGIDELKAQIAKDIAQI